jgi:hypothetical protein
MPNDTTVPLPDPSDPALYRTSDHYYDEFALTESGRILVRWKVDWFTMGKVARPGDGRPLEFRWNEKAMVEPDHRRDRWRDFCSDAYATTASSGSAR